MFGHLICGSYHLPLDGEEDDEYTRSKNNTYKRRRDSKNPYSTRGLDKFSNLLSDLEEKRQKIYSEVGSEDISLVRFAYRNSDDCVPIVVKVKDKSKGTQNINGETKENPQALDKYPIESSSKEVEKLKPESKRKRFSWDLKVDNLRKPSYYLPLVIIFILLFLALFGRSVAILFTSIGWYLVPTITGRGRRLSRKKKLYVRKLSENKMVSDGLLSSSSPRSPLASKDNSSPQQHGHRKSW